MHSIRPLLAAAALVAAAGCAHKLAGSVGGGVSTGVPSKPDVPTAPTTPAVPGGPSEVDAGACGNYAATDAGRKLHAFLEATVELRETIKETLEVEKTSCKMMGGELQMPDDALQGETKDVCDRVFAELKNDLKVSLKKQSALVISFRPCRPAQWSCARCRHHHRGGDRRDQEI